jgi:hypothetical protein
VEKYVNFLLVQEVDERKTPTQLFRFSKVHSYFVAKLASVKPRSDSRDFLDVFIPFSQIFRVKWDGFVKFNSLSYNRLVDMLRGFFGGVRKEGDCTILQTIHACDLDEMELTNEPVIDPQTGRRICLSRADAEIQKKDYPKGRVVPFAPYKDEKGPIL